MADFNFISFPATQVASADPNSLDDYEEGTWVPLQGSGLTVVGSYSSTGTYTKIGRQVTVQGVIQGSTSVAMAAFLQLCTGLPFSANGQGIGTGINEANGSIFSIYVGSTSVSSGTFTACARIDFTVTYFV
jgi:hypothetical protein